MLSATLAPNSIAQTAQLLKQSHFTQDQQLRIESTIEAIAQQNHWTRQHAAHWLNQQAR